MTNAEVVWTATSSAVGNATSAVVAAASSAASAAFQNVTIVPGPFLEYFTIGYIFLLIFLLYPITVTVQKCRKRRKRKSASRRASNVVQSTKTNVAAADQKTQTLVRKSSADTGSESSSDVDDASKISATITDLITDWRMEQNEEASEAEMINMAGMPRRGSLGGITVSFILNLLQECMLHLYIVAH